MTYRLGINLGLVMAKGVLFGGASGPDPGAGQASPEDAAQGDHTEFQVDSGLGTEVLSDSSGCVWPHLAPGSLWAEPHERLL